MHDGLALVYLAFFVYSVTPFFGRALAMTFCLGIVPRPFVSSARPVYFSHAGSLLIVTYDCPFDAPMMDVSCPGFAPRPAFVLKIFPVP